MMITKKNLKLDQKKFEKKKLEKSTFSNIYPYSSSVNITIMDANPSWDEEEIEFDVEVLDVGKNTAAPYVVIE